MPTVHPLTDLMLISSPSNPRIKKIRALSQRKTRRETGLFFVEGIRPVAEAVALRADIDILIVAPDLLRSDFGQETVRTADQVGISTLEVSETVFQTLSRKDGPQGLGAVVRQRWETLEAVQPGDELAWVVLEDVQNPGNLGSILRTCDAVGAAGIILLGDTTDPYDPAAVRSSMGAIFAQRLIRATLDALITWKQQHHLTMIGASDSAEIDYQAMAYGPPILLCMGSEQHGLSDTHTAACDDTVRIPMVGRSDSLNLAVATSVILYEIFNTWRADDHIGQSDNHQITK